MILNINDNKFLIDLQERFSDCFPYLKIEFYDVPCKCGKILSQEHLLPHHLRLCNCRQMHDPGLLDIKSYYTTARVEADFEQFFGLHVQIFRRDINHRAHTCKSKNLSLQQQSQMAESRLQAVKREPEMGEAIDMEF